jgi:beta propeller domain-containing protein
MKPLLVTTLYTAILISGLAVYAGVPSDNLAAHAPSHPASAPKKTMQAFHSDQELATYLREIAEKQMSARRASMSAYAGVAATAELSVPAPSSPSADKKESITNVQHAGVDEGGIVKLHGNHLVVLRRGRLFTVAIGSGALTPISSIDAYGPDINPSGTWYDEMLVSADTIVVIGYSYERGGTEVGLFGIDPAGKLTYRSTYHLRSNDYYSSRNYASRLIGSKLIFYSPLYVYPGSADPFQSFPAVRKWHRGATPNEFRRIVSATQVYKPEHPLDTANGVALHTVTVCDLASGDFDCKATSVIGPPGRVFYVSPESVYIWLTAWEHRGEKMTNRSQLYRMPLDGSSPSALEVSGCPVDQFSFLESDDAHLNVLVRSLSTGDGMWAAERAAGSVALLRVPLSSFSDGSEPVLASSYLRLPTPGGYTFQNRFVGDYLLYGSGSGWGYPQNVEKSRLYAVRWASGDLYPLSLTHGTDRIEQMGSDAVVVGSDGADLHFTAVRLGDLPALADEYIRKGASQGELRSHGFFYKPDARESGMLGLPISLPARPGYRHLFDSSAAILFLKNDSLHFQEVGELGAQPEGAKDDACRASCVDWYGNSQPIFVHGRVIALLGYELVEGALDHGRIWETRRVNYAPQNLTAQR